MSLKPTPVLLHAPMAKVPAELPKRSQRAPCARFRSSVRAQRTPGLPRESHSLPHIASDRQRNSRRRHRPSEEQSPDRSTEEMGPERSDITSLPGASSGPEERQKTSSPRLPFQPALSKSSYGYLYSHLCGAAIDKYQSQRQARDSGGKDSWRHPTRPRGPAQMYQAAAHSCRKS